MRNPFDLVVALLPAVAFVGSAILIARAIAGRSHRPPEVCAPVAPPSVQPPGSRAVAKSNAPIDILGNSDQASEEDLLEEALEAELDGSEEAVS